MNYSLGYIKDLIAFFNFALLYYLVYNYDLHLNKSFVLRLLSLGFLIDGIFSIYPKLHNKEINKIIS